MFPSLPVHLPFPFSPAHILSHVQRPPSSHIRSPFIRRYFEINHRDMRSERIKQIIRNHIDYDLFDDICFDSEKEDRLRRPLLHLLIAFTNCSTKPAKRT